MYKISALNAPATPPYEYSKSYSDIFFDRQPMSPDDFIEHSAFRRVSSMSMPSPPELLIDSEEETASYTSSSSSYHMQKSRKSVPHRSPSNIVDQKSVVFQIEENCTPKIVGGGNGGILWSLRQRVSMARRQENKNRLSAPHPERRVRAMRIQIPRPQWSNPIYDDLVSPTHHQPVKIIPVIIPTDDKPPPVKQTIKTPRKNITHATSGRPSRVKGPCQACQETSDGCMRKAFNWPFPTSTIFNDKGKPFVYLCNKCGLR